MANEDVLVMGPADLYIADFGASEPSEGDFTSPPASGAWHDLGVTMDGAELTVEQEYQELEADQFVDVPGARQVKRSFKCKTKLAEISLDNLLYVLNDGSSSSGAGYKKFEPAYATSATQPTYRAFMVDGWAPGGGRSRLIIRKVLSTDDVTWSYKKDDQSVFEVEFQGFYVDDDTAPWVVYNEILS